MTLRKNLFLSIFFSVLAGFILSSLGLYLVQNKQKKIEIETEISHLTEMICTCNVAYAWGYDTIGLGNSLEAMLKDEQIIGIEVDDYAGNPMATVEEEEIGNIYEVEEVLSMDGMEVGNAKIKFTDYYIAQRYRQNFINVLVLEILLFLIVLIVVMITTGLIVKKPINNLIRVVEDMAHGEGDLTVRIPVNHNNELAILSTHFNSLLTKLHVSMTNLHNVGVSSESLGSNLDSNTKELSNIVSEISENMNQVNDRFGVTYSEMQVSENNVSRINDFINSVADLIKEQSESVAMSTKAIESMIESVSQIEALTETKLSKVQTLEAETSRLEIESKHNVNQMMSASKSTKDIISMVGVINSIASRTNLLAMNAAIEAAHAGTAGKGFAVVSGEIRKLAEQTSKNSKNIENSVSQIVAEIETATLSSQNSSAILTNLLGEIKDVAGGLNDTLAGLKEISRSNTEIISILANLNTLTNSVTASSEEMRSGTAEIKNSITKIMDITSESKKEVDDMAHGLNKVSLSMIDLTHLSKDNSENIDALDSEIRKFKI